MDFEALKTFATSTFLFPILLTIILLYQLSRHVRNNLPPGPHSLPVFGSLGFFRSLKNKGHRVLAEVAARYGPVFSVRAGNRLVVFLNDYQSIHEAFVENSDFCSDRPNWLPSLQAGLRDGKGVAWQNQHGAVPMRKFVMQTLRGFGVGKIGLEEKVRVELDAICDVIRAELGRKLTLNPLLKKAVMNIIHDIVFGTRYPYTDSRLGELEKLIDEFFKGGLFLPNNFLPSIICKLLPKNTEAMERKQAATQKLKDYIYQSIDEHEETFDDVTIRDYIDLYIQASRDEGSEDRSYLTRGNIVRTILDLFIAGADTTATSLEYCFMYMVQHPDIQQRCFEEINQVIDGTNYIEASTKCPYVEAVLMELQRLNKVAPLGLPHYTSGQFEVKGYTIPKETIVFANLYGCCLDPHIWQEPETFQPERFLDADGQIKRNKQLIPFSIGPRICLGEIMAKMEIKVLFMNLVHRFKFSKSDDGDFDNTAEYHPVGRVQAFDVTVTER